MARGGSILEWRGRQAVTAEIRRAGGQSAGVAQVGQSVAGLAHAIPGC